MTHTPVVAWLSPLIRFGLAALFFMPTVLLAQPLHEIYRAALALDPAVLGAQAQWRAANERLTQARAGFGPTAAVTASNLETRFREQPDFALRPFHSKQVNLQVTQPLVRTSLYSAFDAAQAQLDQAQAQLDQARAEGMQRLAEACFEVLKARDALSLLQAQRASTLEQLASAQRTYKIGTAPITDVREAEAKADSVAAQLDAAEHELDLRQQMLAEIVGHSVPGLLKRGLDDQRLPPLEASDISEWLVNALAQSPQLHQARQALVVAEAELRRAWQGHGPTADLTYTYTRSAETGSSTSPLPRSIQSSAVGVNVNVPLFASGATQAKVRELMASRDKAQSDLAAVRRNITLGVRQGFSATLSSISQARGMQAATRSADLSLRANKRGYEVGMKVNAQVLDSQSRVFEARRDLSRARYDAWLSYVKLKAVAGQLVEGDLEQLDSLLVAVDTLPPESGPNREREEQ